MGDCFVQAIGHAVNRLLLCAIASLRS